MSAPARMHGGRARCGPAVLEVPKRLPDTVGQAALRHSSRGGLGRQLKARGLDHQSHAAELPRCLRPPAQQAEVEPARSPDAKSRHERAGVRWPGRLPRRRSGRTRAGGRRPCARRLLRSWRPAPPAARARPGSRPRGRSAVRVARIAASTTACLARLKPKKSRSRPSATVSASDPVRSPGSSSSMTRNS